MKQQREEETRKQRQEEQKKREEEMRSVRTVPVRWFFDRVMLLELKKKWTIVCFHIFLF